MGRRNTGLVGQRAEQYAFDYLRQRNLRPVARNFRRRGGEIDLIMLDDGCLTFIEVRYRASIDFVAPIDTVEYHKQRRIIRTAAMFVAKNTRYAAHTMRFDVLAIQGVEKPDVTWIKDAFRPNNSSL